MLLLVASWFWPRLCLTLWFFLGSALPSPVLLSPVLSDLVLLDLVLLDLVLLDPALLIPLLLILLLCFPTLVLSLCLASWEWDGAVGDVMGRWGARAGKSSGYGGENRLTVADESMAVELMVVESMVVESMAATALVRRLVVDVTPD